MRLNPQANLILVDFLVGARTIHSVRANARTFGEDTAMAPQKPGEPADKSGIYKPTKGGGTEVAISKGDRLPPTVPGGKWVLKTPTQKGK
jgi:hypothetical protein